MTSLSIQNLSKTFPGNVHALKDFSLEIGEGELVAIVGPSGCGKSTLLRILAGLEEENTGTVRLGSRVLNGIPPKDRDIAVVFQSYTLMPHLSVADNLGFGLKLRGEKKSMREAKILEAAKLLNIEGLLQRYPSEISGGERQRVALGRAILREPKVFLFDEPLSSLDAQMRLQLRVEIQRLHQRLKVPMIFVTHDQSEALTLGDRVVVLNQGSIQQIATPEELYLRPANTFTASFIGSPGMNLFHGSLQTSAAGTHFASSALNFLLSAEQAEKLRDHAEIIAGIRPEHLHSVESGGKLSGKVTAVEKQAGQTGIYLQNDATSFSVKTITEPVTKVDETLKFDFSPREIVFFNTKGGFLLPIHNVGDK